jgi:hypothetical protein
MRARGVKSPDIADAFVMAFGVEPFNAYNWLPFSDTGRSEIAKAHNWVYTGQESEENEAGRAGDITGSLSAFGVHSNW